jgi:hypothetical protein
VASNMSHFMPRFWSGVHSACIQEYKAYSVSVINHMGVKHVIFILCLCMTYHVMYDMSCYVVMYDMSCYVVMYDMSCYVVMYNMSCYVRHIMLCTKQNLGDVCLVGGRVVVFAFAFHRLRWQAPICPARIGAGMVCWVGWPARVEASLPIPTA